MKEERTGGRKEKDDRTRRERIGGDVRGSTQHKCFLKGEQIHSSIKTSHFSLTVVPFIELKVRGREERKRGTLVVECNRN